MSNKVTSSIAAVVVVFVIVVLSILVYNEVADQGLISTQSETVTQSGNTSWYNYTLDESLHPSSTVSITLYNTTYNGGGTSWRTYTLPAANITWNDYSHVITVHTRFTTGANLHHWDQWNLTWQSAAAYSAEEDITPTSTDVFSLAPLVGLIMIAAVILGIIGYMGTGKQGL